MVRGFFYAWSRMPQKITDDELLARVDQELRQAIDYMGGKLSVQRRKAMQYYMAQPEGDLSPPEVEGRSSIVSTDVADTVEWMLPSLLRIFTASDSVVQLTPRKPGMEQVADDATDYLNWIFTTQNDGFGCLYTMFKDALISKCGVLKVWWEDKKEEAREEYEGLSDAELAQLLEDEEVTPIEHAARIDEDDAKQRAQALQQIQAQLGQLQPGSPQQAQLIQRAQVIQQSPPVTLHDVTVKRVRKSAQVRIEPVPPEEFFISRQAKKIKDAPFVAHVREWLVSDLRAEGYKIDDDAIPADDAGLVMGMERAQRWSYDDSAAPYAQMFEPSADPSMRTVWVVEAYFRADVDGDGIAEWRRLLKCGQTILDNVECDGPPFVSVTPIPMPHRFMGISVADLSMEAQRQKTHVLRAMLDNLYLQVNGRYYAVDGQVNLDDLLTSRPGGVVRIKSQGAVGPLNQGMADMGQSHQLLEYLEDQKENRTGWTRQSNGPGENVINKTATEVATVTNRADMRTELIARVFAETGVKDLFRHILELVCKYQQQPAEFRLNGRWLSINPREWRHQFDLSVNVGLGSNDPTQRVGMLTRLMQVQSELAQAGTGIVTPKQAYESAKEMVKALGYKDSDRFLVDPGTVEPKAEQQSPEQVKAQAEAQAKQVELQAQMQIKQLEFAHSEKLATLKAQHDMQVDANRQGVQAEQIKQQRELDAQLEAMKTQHQQELERVKIEAAGRVAAMREEVALQIARENNARAIEVALISTHSKVAPKSATENEEDADGNGASVSE